MKQLRISDSSGLASAASRYVQIPSLPNAQSKSVTQQSTMERYEGNDNNIPAYTNRVAHAVEVSSRVPISSDRTPRPSFAAPTRVPPRNSPRAPLATDRRELTTPAVVTERSVNSGSGKPGDIAAGPGGSTAQNPVLRVSLSKSAPSSDLALAPAVGTSSLDLPVVGHGFDRTTTAQTPAYGRVVPGCDGARSPDVGLYATSSSSLLLPNAQSAPDQRDTDLCRFPLYGNGCVDPELTYVSDIIGILVPKDMATLGLGAIY